MGSERLYGNEDDDGGQQQDRGFVEPAIEHMAARISVGGELFHQPAAIIMIAGQHDHQEKLGVHPSAADAVAQP